MAHGLKRPPAIISSDNSSKAYWRYAKLSKADWADVFSDMVEEYMGEGVQGHPCTPDQIMNEAERRLQILKDNGIR